jgi:hypothetical protein
MNTLNDWIINPGKTFHGLDLTVTKTMESFSMVYYPIMQITISMIFIKLTVCSERTEATRKKRVLQKFFAGNYLSEQEIESITNDQLKDYLTKNTIWSEHFISSS